MAVIPGPEFFRVRSLTCAKWNANRRTTLLKRLLLNFLRDQVSQVSPASNLLTSSEVLRSNSWSPFAAQTATSDETG